MSQEFTIVAARPEDGPALAEICRQAYPDSLRWNGSAAYRRRWWREVLAAAATETWLAWQAGQAAGFILLVRDIPAFAQMKARLRPTKMELASTFLGKPVAVIKKFFMGVALEQDSEADPAKNVLWLENIAIANKFQGQGLGSRLVEWAQQQARQQGFALGLTVKSSNSRAAHVYGKHGFKEKRRQGDLVTMWKDPV